MDLSRLLAASRGERPADLLLTGGKVVNVFTGEIVTCDIAIADSRIAGLGAGYRANEVVALDQRFVCPGFIDAHTHIESAMVPPGEFANAVVPHGLTTAITDPHEIANVLGIEGIRFMLRDAREGPLRVEVNASSCVPATALATSGARLNASDLVLLQREPEVLGLAEVMDYSGVIAGRAEILDKIRAFSGRPIDGHCPGLDGPGLNAYVAAGIQSDHECTTLDEARRKLRLGLTIFVRQGTAARNLHALLPLVNAANERRFCFCTDDRQIPDLIEEGSIDHLVRTAVGAGLDPISAIRMGTINVADHFRLSDRGAVAPGRLADLVVFRDLHDLRAEQVYIGGRRVAADGGMLEDRRPPVREIADTVNVNWTAVSLEVPAEGSRVRAIGIVPDQLLTESLLEDVRIENGMALADPDRDLLKIAVIERHRASGNVGRGFVKGLGLERGAIAGTVAHDHHNLIVAGTDDRSMMTAARAVARAGGGLAAAEGDAVRALCPLPIAGLMSDRDFRQVAADLKAAIGAARELGSGLRDPFMTMSFLALEVIPSLKLTDRGLVDVERMQLVPLFPTSRGPS